MGNKHVTEANRFLFWVEGSKGYPTHTCQYVIMKEIKTFLCQALKLRQIFLLFLSINSMIP